MPGYGGGAGAAPAAGGDAARGVGTEMYGGADRCAGGGGVGDRAVEQTVAQEGGDSGMASPPSTGNRSGVQSPGGEPSRSMATAGLPAEGGGGGYRESVWQERQRTTTAVDR